MASAGSLRVLSFARHLPEFGWQPLVVTIDDTGFPRIDAALLRRLPPDAEIIRSMTPFSGSFATRKRPNRTAQSGDVRVVVQSSASRRGWRSYGRSVFDRWVAVPDHTIAWHLLAGLKAGWLVRRNGIQAIVTSAPPISAIAGGLIAKAVSRATWVADLRDPWDDGTRGDRRTLRFRCGAALERRAVESADTVLANTPRFGERLRAESPDRAGRIEVLPNGYDEEEIGRARSQADGTSPERPLTIVHAGTFYPGERDPWPVLEGIARARDIVGGRRRFRVILAGDRVLEAWPDYAQRLSALRLDDVVELPGFLPHADTLACLAQADLAVLVQGGGFVLQVPSKAYEYLAVGTPVLAVTTEGATADLVRATARGTVVAPDDVEGVTRVVAATYQRRPERFMGPVEGIHSRRELAGRLATILDRLVERR